MQTLDIDGLKFACTLAGDPSAPPLVLVHGWLSHRGVWRQTIAALQHQYYCVAIDLLGFGDSDKPAAADYSIPAQARRVLQVVDQLEIEAFTLIGHSMGGQIALYIASALAPARVSRLVSVSGVVTGRLMPRVERLVYPMIAAGAMFPGLYALGRLSNRFRRLAYWYFRPWFYKMESIPFESWEIDRRMALQPGVQIPSHKAGQAIHDLDLRPYLADISAPTLAIFGRQDGTVPVSDGYLVGQGVRNGTLALIDACGHFPMYEQTQQYLEILGAFLAA